MKKSDIICFDLETTGLRDKDEILQLSIIDGNFEILFNEYIKPEKLSSWPEAEAVNHISPQLVMDKKPLLYYKEQIEDIFNSAELIVGYNCNLFDFPFLYRSGINVGNNIPSFDVMLEFAEIYGDWNENHGSYKWQKLITCAAYYGYRQEGNFHDSLEDVKATLFCYYKIQEYASAK